MAEQGAIAEYFATEYTPHHVIWGVCEISQTKRHIQSAPPSGEGVTLYDRANLVLFMRLLDAEANGADWREVAEVLFAPRCCTDIEQLRAQYLAHLNRANWLANSGYLNIIKRAGSSNL